MCTLILPLYIVASYINSVEKRNLAEINITHTIPTYFVI